MLLGKRQKNWANIGFLSYVYMIFKYSKRFRFAPSFNKGLKHCLCIISREMTRSGVLNKQRVISISRAPQYICSRGHLHIMSTLKGGHKSTYYFETHGCKKFRVTEVFPEPCTYI